MEKILRKNLRFMTERLTNVVPVLIRLVDHKIITLEEFHRVRNERPYYDHNIKLLSILMKKDNKDLLVFLEILRETGNEDIVRRIEKTGDILSEVVNFIDSESEFTSSDDEPGTSKSRKFSSSLKISERPSKKLLKEKWWPERKFLPPTYYHRHRDNKLITEMMHSLFHDDQNKTTVIAQIVVSGLGGIGKTSIAKSFAVQHENEYDHIIWIDCGEGSLITSLQSLARNLAIENRSELNLTELAENIIVQLQELKCLIIYDNTECYIGSEGICDVLPKFEGSNNLHSIITSRNQKWGTEAAADYGNITNLCMNVFSKGDTVQFLKNSLSKSVLVNNSELSRLGDLLGHLPLALKIAAVTLKNQQITITDYIEKISRNDKCDILLDYVIDDYKQTLNKTMKISLDQIKNSENGINDYTILTTLAYLRPNDVEFTFLRDVVKLELVDVQKGISVLENHSLVNVEKKREGQSECVNINVILQLVIRHNEHDSEKQIIRNILSCKGNIEYKIIPYTFAENHEDLKTEFAHVRAQLIDEISLADLLSKRQFDEATTLALIIHNTFDLNESKTEYLLSKYNYAVCLEKGGRKTDSVKIFRSLYEDIGSEEDSCLNWSREASPVWSIDDNNSIQFHLKPLDQSIPTKLSITNCIDLCQPETLLGQLKCYESCASQFTRHKMISPIQLILLLHLGLIVTEGMNTLVFGNDFIDAIDAYNGMIDSIDLISAWMNFTSKLAKVAIKLIPRKERLNGKVLTTLFSVSRKYLLRIENKEFLIDFSRGKLLCDDLHVLMDNLKTNKNLSSLQEVISDLMLSITNKFPSEDMKELIQQPHSDLPDVHPGPSNTDDSVTKGILRGHSWISPKKFSASITIRHKKALTTQSNEKDENTIGALITGFGRVSLKESTDTENIHSVIKLPLYTTDAFILKMKMQDYFSKLNCIVINKNKLGRPEIFHTLTKCVSLSKLVFDNIEIIGTYDKKAHLSKLRHVKMNLVSANATPQEIEYYTLFYKKDTSLFDILGINYVNVNFNRDLLFEVNETDMSLVFKMKEKLPIIGSKIGFALKKLTLENCYVNGIPVDLEHLELKNVRIQNQSESRSDIYGSTFITNRMKTLIVDCKNAHCTKLNVDLDSIKYIQTVSLRYCKIHY